MHGRTKNRTPGINYTTKNLHRGIKNSMIEISLYPTGQNSAAQHTSWIESAGIADSEYVNQDLNYLVHITRC